MTNIDELHRTGELLYCTGTYPRQVGKTHYFCHLVAGYLEVLENETITIVVENERRIQSFTDVLEPVLQEHGFEIIFTDFYAGRLLIKDNTNQIKFYTPASARRMHPSQGGSSLDQYLIADLDNLPPQFFQSDFTVRDLDWLLYNIQ